MTHDQVVREDDCPASEPLESVSVLLGHASVKITEKHYRPWVRSLQRKLEKQVQRAWTSQ